MLDFITISSAVADLSSQGFKEANKKPEFDVMAPESIEKPGADVTYSTSGNCISISSTSFEISLVLCKEAASGNCKFTK